MHLRQVAASRACNFKFFSRQLNLSKSKNKGADKRLTCFAPWTRPSHFSSSSSSSSPQYGNWVESKKFDECGDLAVFGDYADEYDKFRPYYPSFLFDDACKNLSKKSALDVCCGTGRGALELKSRGFECVIAVDADKGMLRNIKKTEDNIVTLQSSAEEMTAVADDSINLIVCLQAFHWLDPEKALTEFRRVLAGDGKILIAWNDRNLDDPFIEKWEGLIEKHNPKYHRSIKLAESYENSMKCLPGLGITKRVYANPQLVSADDFIAQMLTFSYVRNALSPDALNAIEDETRELISKTYGVQGSVGKFELQWSTKAYELNRNRSVVN